VTRPVVVAPGASDREWSLAEAGAPLELDRLVPPPAGPLGAPAAAGGWEMEIGFGKGRYLIARAEREPSRRFLGIEIANQYFRILVGRARRRGLANLLAVRGEALYLLSAVLPRGFARAIHVYHPDPWPKSRHHKRRLFDPETLDLVLGALAPGGELYFATDHPEYGEWVMEVLGSYPAATYRRLDGPWPDGLRTNYEAKYVAEGRPILRLVVEPVAPPSGRSPGASPGALHPEGRAGVLVGPRPASEGDGARVEPHR
jgi:tRNA (guanine-N7-)-methyltransferase